MPLADAPAAAPVVDDRPLPTSYAHWWRRAVASVLDGALVGAVAWLATASVTPVPFRLVPWPTDVVQVGGVEPAGQFSWWTCAAVVLLLLAQALTGTTPGKAVVGIRVVREADGAPAGVLRTIGRELLHLLDWIFLIGWLRPLWHARRQTFADTIASTVVVPARPPAPVRLLGVLVGVAAIALVVAPTVSETGETTVACQLPDAVGGVESLTLRIPGDLSVTRLGWSRTSSAHPAAVATWVLATDTPPTEGTQLHAALADRDDHEVWQSTVTFRDDAAYLDARTEVTELVIPHDAWAQAPGGMVTFTAEVGGERTMLCGAGGPDAPEQS